VKQRVKESLSQRVKENARRGAPQAQKCSICLVPRATPWSNIQCMPIWRRNAGTHLATGAGLELRCHKRIHRVRERRQIPAKTPAA
jgi:hypothetical protein